MVDNRPPPLAAQRLYLAANIWLGAGVVALGAAYASYVHNRNAARHEDEQREEQRRQQAFLFGVQPTTSGAVGVISGSF